MAVRPLTPAQSLENEAFLAELCRTGNVREAARRIGAHRAKFTRRRGKHPEFAALWQAALALSQEILAEDAFHPGLTRLADGRLQLHSRGDYSLNADRRLEFLAMLGTSGSARFAAEAVGFSHTAFFHYRERDPDFARAWHLALYGTGFRLEEDVTGGEPDVQAGTVRS
jgi:hypothetical protein